MSEDRATYPSCQRRLGAGRPEKTSWARPWALPVLKDLEALVDHGEEEPLADLLAPALHSSFQASTGFHQRGLHRVAALSTRPRRSRRAASCPSTCGPRPAWPRPPGPPEVSLHATEDGPNPGTQDARRAVPGRASLLRPRWMKTPRPLAWQRRLLPAKPSAFGRSRTLIFGSGVFRPKRPCSQSQSSSRELFTSHKRSQEHASKLAGLASRAPPAHVGGPF